MISFWRQAMMTLALWVSLKKKKETQKMSWEIDDDGDGADDGDNGDDDGEEEWIKIKK